MSWRLRMLNENTENQDYERLALIRSKLMQLAAKIEELEKHAQARRDHGESGTDHRAVDEDSRRPRSRRRNMSSITEAGANA